MTKVFLSYAGNDGLHLANGLRLFFSELWGERVQGMIVPSESGREIWQTIKDNVSVANLAMFCLTPRNRRAEWLHAEFGMLYQRLNPGAMIPILYDLKVKKLQPPFNGFEGIVVDRKSVEAPLRIVRRITAEGPADVGKARIQKAWNLAVAKHIGNIDGHPHALSVGWNESEEMHRLIDSCDKLNSRDNQFRKFICSLVLDHASRAFTKLATKVPETSIDDFIKETSDRCSSARCVHALCGGKEWGKRRVKEYYSANFEVAERAQEDGDGVVRVFLQPKPPGKFRGDQKAAINAHVERRRSGSMIDPRILPFKAKTKLVHMPGVFSDLLERGFGFAIITDRSGSRVAYTHLGKEGATKDDGKFIWARYEDPLLVGAIEELFVNLRENSETCNRTI